MTKPTVPLVKIGFMSGLNYGSEGCREGFWRLAAEIFRLEDVNYVVIIGLVDGRAMETRLKERLKGVAPADKVHESEEFIEEVGDYIVENFTRIPGVKIYAIVSPPLDRDIGEKIASYVTENRKDIFLYNAGGDRFEIKQIGKILGAYAPKKAVWMRGDYFDTPILRVLKDERKRGTRGIGDTNAVGGFASAIYHPGDSSDVGRPYFSLPALYKITETRTAENQIGVRILKVTSKNLKEAHVITYNFKDLASEEWGLVQAPPESSEIQKKIVETIKSRGPVTIGQLEDFMSVERKKIAKALKGLVKRRKSKSWSKIIKDEKSQRYYFDLEWLQKDLDYPLAEFDGCALDAMVAFGCIHAGCPDTDMKYFVDAVPPIILENGATMLVGCGDFIEGLKHDLMLRGDVYGSRRFPFNYTHQEKLAAYLVSRLTLAVFEARIAPFMKSVSQKVEHEILDAEVRKNLLDFVFIAGNHCEWVKPLGFDPLGTFLPKLKEYLAKGVKKILASRGLRLYNLDEIMNAKVVKLEQNEPRWLASGLSATLLHPSLSRTKTTSIRPQEMLNKAGTQIVIGANFHVAEALEQWEFERGGQRVCLQVGTLKHKSSFEEGKLKIVDFGIGLLRVWSKNKRIKKTETAFYGTRTPNLREANEAILKEFEDFVEENEKKVEIA